MKTTTSTKGSITKARGGRFLKIAVLAARPAERRNRF
jgi:hypothetical protein